MDFFAMQALEEYNSEKDTVRRAGYNGKPFWNAHASQFMFAPQFLFPTIPGAEEYLYTATDCNGSEHQFTDKSSLAPLSPIWRDIPVGYVTLKVEALHRRGGTFLAGTRTFYKSAPFPGREALPPRARSYKESAEMAFRFLFEDKATQYWLKKGVPDPEYYHNVYPSKMISAIVRAMLAYAKLAPERASDAIRLAKNAADYLLSITYGEGSPLEGLPPTYSFKGLNREIVNANAPAAEGRSHAVMMIYPAQVGSMYLRLEAVTGDCKYFEAAKRIADYYDTHVLPCGSWHLLVSEKTGASEANSLCLNFTILSFLREFYDRTKEERFRVLSDGYFRYIEKTCLDGYHWEGQFEDSGLPGHYQNLTHLNADKMIAYITAERKDDPAMMEEAKALMRFVEDQFVVWEKHAPWSTYLPDGGFWHAPAGLEQYLWYVPIDGSTAAIMRAFLDLYEATGDELLLEKARALGDSITRLQNPDCGVYPTHWQSKNCMYELYNFWINCHIGTAEQMLHLAEVMGET